MARNSRKIAILLLLFVLNQTINANKVSHEASYEAPLTRKTKLEKEARGRTSP